MNKNSLCLAVSMTLCAAAGTWGAEPPRTDPVIASFGLTTIEEPNTRTCIGVDGEYVHLRDTFAGNLVSTDARLSGTLTVDADILTNLTTGYGAGDGNWRITDVAGNELLSGDFVGTVSAAARFIGTARGTTPDGDRFAGGISVIVSPDGTAVGDVGSPAGASVDDPAVFQVGGCFEDSGDDSGVCEEDDDDDCD